MDSTHIFSENMEINTLKLKVAKELMKNTGKQLNKALEMKFAMTMLQSSTLQEKKSLEE
jgi:hypothetical protein